MDLEFTQAIPSACGLGIVFLIQSPFPSPASSGQPTLSPS